MTIMMKDSARTRAYDRIRAGILNGTFPAGSFIEEAQASALAEVSRTPVREALNQLAAEGFLDLLPRRGAMVRHVTAQELVDLYEARKLIEGHAADVICETDRGAPPEMRRLAAEMEALPLEDALQHVELNGRFHAALMAHCGNQILIRMSEAMSANVTRIGFSAFTIDRDRRALIDREHSALVEALDAGDAARARAILKVHLEAPAHILAKLPR
ncbi:GntR family transcriptional regulator [Poseidonocella sp. HB161398]|uniref:GntR family transcriptional regulator n=1 Tax=Poseidonocella sp. HB161398 TaxID=2320855 RepID=UPI001486AB8E|nr:GntR family transcriptional regulator [Poseidonocella sp. HB161398]